MTSVSTVSDSPCVECDRTMVPRRTWGRLSAADRDGKVCAQAHGRCCGCWHHTRPSRRRAKTTRSAALDAATLDRLRRDVGLRVEGGVPTP